MDDDIRAQTMEVMRRAREELSDPATRARVEGIKECLMSYADDWGGLPNGVTLEIAKGLMCFVAVLGSKAVRGLNDPQDPSDVAFSLVLPSLASYAKDMALLIASLEDGKPLTEGERVSWEALTKALQAAQEPRRDEKPGAPGDSRSSGDDAPGMYL